MCGFQFRPQIFPERRLTFPKRRVPLPGSPEGDITQFVVRVTSSGEIFLFYFIAFSSLLFTYALPHRLFFLCLVILVLNSLSFLFFLQYVFVILIFLSILHFLVVYSFRPPFFLYLFHRFRPHFSSLFFLEFSLNTFLFLSLVLFVSLIFLLSLYFLFVYFFLPALLLQYSNVVFLIFPP